MFIIICPNILHILHISFFLGLYNQQKRIEQALSLAASYYSMKMVQDSGATLARSHLMKRKIRPSTAFKFQIGIYICM
jgi:hypothetical protein